MEIVPYKEDKSAKKQQVAKMFDNISHRYDFLNHFLSLGIDKGWRRKAVNMLRPIHPRLILDVATGTGDFAIQALCINPEKVIGVDISEGMLEVGRRKLARKELHGKIELLTGDSENLPFEENKFDAVIVGFGVRNFENVNRGLEEIKRVLKPGGMLVILEFSRPGRFPFRQVYHFYFRYVLPKLGRIISRDKAAYTYLPESVEAFPDGDDFLAILTNLGFKEPACKPVTFGISSIYSARK
ncbi:bifunctional demethylmenaquinone methyltransferase/2-methoxy-6-polyprenyl-1,4-benzoquinol methylase UbiE [Oscillatoria amoena NRMC-F 0135]|nr:bifunctional demethylmenaquinone methyltransferase/2-methoxy-6-polyprenyl-1,4-benzoquinol methylase UbiE [Oscillatoria amoena NRMC-F 0135]